MKNFKQYDDKIQSNAGTTACKSAQVPDINILKTWIGHRQILLSKSIRLP